MTTTVPDARLTTADEVQELLGRPVSAVIMKQIDHVDAGAATVLTHSPVAGLGYEDRDGLRHSTVVGGEPGFLNVLSPTRIALTLPPASARPATGRGASLVFLLPGISEVLRLNGTLLEHDGDRVVVGVQELYVHCARAVGRAQLWLEPAPRASRRAPSTTSGSGPLDGAGVRTFLAAAPFLLCTTGDAAGGSDTSPRGDRPGFVRVLDGRTIAIPDRRGNRRADTLLNLLQDDRIALAVMVPGRTQVLHLHGTATISTDPDLLAEMALRGLTPHAALLIDVLGADLVDSEPVRRARLWEQDAHVDPTLVPDLNILATEHLAANPANRAGLPLRLLAALLRRFPNLTRRMMRHQFGAALAKEGYDAVEGSRASTPPADVPTRRFRVTAVRPETADTMTVVLRDAAATASPLVYTPGQFFTFAATVDGRTARRAYSAASPPGAPDLEITIKRVDGGFFSTHVHRTLRIGDELEVRGPSGTLFDLGSTDDCETVMIAAGSGVTPMMSLVRSRLSGPVPSGSARMLLLYGNRDEKSIIFASELDRLQRTYPDRLEVAHQLTRPGASWTGRTGRITAGSLNDWLGVARPAADARYYLCGPQDMMDEARGALLDDGVPPDRIRLESYSSAIDDPSSASGQAHRMQVVDGTTATGSAEVAPGETLLDAGLAAGLPMPYSCTVGSCGECVVKLLGGQVTMSQPNGLTQEQQADGYVLTCVGRPQSEVTVDIADV